MSPLIIALLVSFAIGNISGGMAVHAVLNAELAELKAASASEQAKTQQLYIQRLTAEQARGDELSSRLSQTETQLSQRTEEVSRALQKVTTGRACLNSATVRLLNSAGPDHPAVPETAGATVAEDAAIATDTDVAGWIGNAQGEYETCRARLNALIDFEQGKP
jgi:prophage endopeptidase